MFRHFIWDISGKLSGYIIGLVTSIFMSRLISPEDFGILSLAQIFSLMVSVIMEMGLSSALIQRKELSKEETDVVFTVNFVIVAVLTLTLFMSAPVISGFYNSDKLVNAIRLICIQLLFSGLSVVPMALLYRSLSFKQIMSATTVSAFIGSFIAIIFAYNGYGYYSLVLQGVITSVILFFIVFKLSGFSPNIDFKVRKSRELFNFSYKIFLSTVLNQIFQKIDILIFGRMYPLSKLGYYNRATSLDNILRTFSSSSILNVLLPRISKIQDDKKAVTEMYLMILHLLSFLFFLLSGLIFLNADIIISVLFGPQWVDSSLMLKLLLLSSFAYPVSSLMLSVIEGFGKGGLFLKLELVKKVITIPFLILPFFLSIESYLSSLLLLSYLGVYINAIGLGKVLLVNPLYSLMSIAGYNIIAVFSVGISAFLVYYLNLNMVGDIILGSISMISLYVLLNLVFKRKGITYCYTELVVKLFKRLNLN